MNWYYLENGIQRGPITEAEFPALFQVGVIGPETPLWHEGLPDWKPYRELVGVAIFPGPSGANQAPPPGLAPGTGQQTGPATERIIDCSQCWAPTPLSQIMKVGSASLCPKCQAAYRRQAQLGFEEKPLEYAKPLVRFVAFLLDLLLCATIAVGLVVGGRFSGARFFPGNNSVLNWIELGTIVLSALWTLDYFIGRLAREGATPLMKMCKIKVVTTSGARVGLFRALIRWLGILMTNAFTLGIGHFLVFFNKKHRSLHDLLSGTVVVRV